MKKTLVVLLTLALLLPCAAAFAMDTLAGGEAAEAPFKFPNGLTWDAAIADVCDTENVENARDYLLQEHGNIQEYWFAAPEPDDGPVGTYYIFVGDVLACLGIDYFPNDPANVAVLQDELTTAYGDPADTNPAQVVDMFNAYKTTFPPEILTSVTGWEHDGIQIYCTNISGEIYVFYANESRLYGNAD